MPSPLPLIHIDPSERVLIVGTSGCGKSWHTRRVLMPRFAVRPIVFDPKERWADRHGEVVIGFDAKRRMKTGTYPIVRLPDYEERDGPALWDYQAQAVLRDAPHTIIADELTLITGEQKLPPALGRILRTGRDTKGGSVGLWMHTQQPQRIPTSVWGLSNHKFIFMLERDDDILRVGRETVKDIIPYLRRLRKYDYVYYNRERGMLIHVKMKSRRDKP